MSNSLTPKSPAHAAALDVVLAAIASIEQLTHSTPDEESGRQVAAFVNTLFNETLKNFQKS
ncbi:hypothetical protein [Metapseudomonas otitidis]|uniref:hypothetical protein n=1 Tax=Metapseudomonas otitidis TaxID=319939 RepID=UPI0013F67316|nr:hypothetical protein [Pseudomonas otitidis]